MAASNDYALLFLRESAGSTEILRLPVNPETLPVERASANESYNVLALGPVMAPRTPELKTITIESYFPGRADRLTLTAGSFREPAYYLAFFERAMQEGEILSYLPVRCYEDGTPFWTEDVGCQVLVTGFRYEERGGETGDFYYTLELTEYRDYTPVRLQVQQPAAQGEAAVVSTENSRSIPQGQLYVGAAVAVNGPYYYSSYGEEPHGNGNGRTCKISRLITDDGTRPYPVHLTTEAGGALGWCKKEVCQVVEQ